MNFEEFETIVLNSVESLNSYSSQSEDSFVIENNTIRQSHVTGGAEGGNCWGDEARHFRNPKPPQEFIPLDKILTTVNPEISYLKYREIQKLIKEGGYNDSEYYGNYTEYVTYSLDIRQLYDALFLDERNE